MSVSDVGLPDRDKLNTIVFSNTCEEDIEAINMMVIDMFDLDIGIEAGTGKMIDENEISLRKGQWR